jgi:hypothetical protein
MLQRRWNYTRAGKDPALSEVFFELRTRLRELKEIASWKKPRK